MAGQNPDLVVRVAANITALQEDMAKAAGSIKTIETATTTASAAMSEMSNIVGRMGERIVAAFAIHEVIGFTEDLFTAAHALEILSLQTGINTTELQVLGEATREFGLDSNQLGTLVFQLSRRIAGNDESAATALHMLGLSMNEVRNMDQETLFLTVARAIGTASARAADLAATDLFGGKAGKQVIAFSKDVDGSMSDVRKSVNLASDQSIKDLAAMEVQIQRTESSFKSWATTAVGPLAQGVNVLTDAANHGASKWDIFKAVLTDFALSNSVTGAHTSALTQLLLDHNVVAKASADATKAGTDAHKEAIPVLSARQQAEAFLNKTRMDSAQPILAWQASDLEQLRAMGELTTKNAEAIGVSAAQLKVYEQGLKDTAEVERVLMEVDAAATKAQKDKWLELQRVTDEYYKVVNAASHDSVQKQIDDAYLAADAKIAAMTKAKNYSVEAEMVIWKTAEQTANNIIQKTLEQDVHTKAHFVMLADQAKAAYDFAAAHSEQYTYGEVQRLRDVADAAQLAAERFGMDFTQAAEQSSTAVKTATDSIKASIASISVAFSSLSPEQGGTRGAPGSWQYQFWQQLQGMFFQNNPPPMRADGGPVSSGMPYMVGERGTDLFVPASSGSIVPNGATGGHQTIVINVTQPLGTPQAIARAVDDAMTRRLTGTGVRMPTSA